MHNVFFFKCHLTAQKGYVTQTSSATGTDSSNSRLVHYTQRGLWCAPSLGVGQFFWGDAVRELLSWEATFGLLYPLVLASQHQSILPGS